MCRPYTTQVVGRHPEVKKRTEKKPIKKNETKYKCNRYNDF